MSRSPRETAHIEDTRDPAVEIRRASPGEAAELTAVAFESKRHWGYPDQWIAAWASALTVSQEFIAAADVWKASVSGETAGFYALFYFGQRASLEHFWLRPGCMGKGIGRALFRHAIARGGEKGCTVLEIESDPNAEGFYLKMGARRIGERRTQVLGENRFLPVLEIPLKPEQP